MGSGDPLRDRLEFDCSPPPAHNNSIIMTRAKESRPCIKLRDMDEKNMHNLFLNPNSKRGGMATHAGVALELGISRPHGSGAKMMSPQMEAILIWCQCRTREYDNVKIENFTNSWADGLAFCALIHHFFPQSFDFSRLSADNRKANYELAFQTGERFAGIPDFLTAED